MRAEVRRFSSCLASLSDTESRYLSLRAGLEGTPLSRADAARAVGIPASQASGVERSGLRHLRSACGGGSGSAHAIANTTSRMPSFQPTSLLVATGGSTPPQLVDQSALGPRGKQGVKGEHATSPPASQGGGAQEATITSQPLSAASSGGLSAAWIAIFAALALMAAVTIVALRGRRGTNPYALPPGTGATSGPLVAAAPPPRVLEPETDPEPEPAVVEPAAQPDPEPARPAPPVFTAPPAQAPERHGRDYGRAARPAAMLASGIISFAARELMRRRRRGGRRR